MLGFFEAWQEISRAVGNIAIKCEDRIPGHTFHFYPEAGDKPASLISIHGSFVRNNWAAYRTAILWNPNEIRGNWGAKEPIAIHGDTSVDIYKMQDFAGALLNKKNAAEDYERFCEFLERGQRIALFSLII